MINYVTREQMEAAKANMEEAIALMENIQEKQVAVYDELTQELRLSDEGIDVRKMIAKMKEIIDISYKTLHTMDYRLL